jgi:hypothetical protein
MGVMGSQVFRRRMRLVGLTVGLAVIAVVGGATSRAARAVLPALPNTVQQWNKIAEDTVVGSGAFQGEGELYMGYTATAVYDAVVAIDGGYQPYGPGINAPAGASVDCAVVEAAYRTLHYYFSTKPALIATLDGYYADALANLNGCTSDGGSGTSVGLAAANSIIALRTGDGRLTPIGTTSSFETKDPGPGVWRLTPPFAPAQTPWLAAVQPFLLKSAGQFQPPAPFPLTSTRWVRAFDEIKAYGGTTSTARTPQETAIAWFWTANVIRQFNRGARDLATAHALSLLETARLFAMVNTVSADALMSVLTSKYKFLFWRPVTAIDPSAVTADGYGPVPGFDDGNPRTTEEPGWRPLAPTPNHPEYPGAHGTNTSALAEVFREFLGTDNINLTLHGFDANGAPGNLDAVQTFATAADLRSEIVNARLWAGLHYRFSTEAGVQLGAKIAHYGLNHAFNPAH